MKHFKILITLVALCVSFCDLYAQEECTDQCFELGYQPYSYWFVQVQGGGSTAFTNVKFTDLIQPTASIGIGRWLHPAIGARLHANGWESKGGFGNGLKYKYKYITTDADLLINLSNVFAKGNRNKLFNVIFVGGLGLNYSWNNDELKHILISDDAPLEDTSNAWGKKNSRKQLFSQNLRAGLILDFNLAKHWNVGLEIDANSLDDRFNSKYSNKDDWMVTAQIGVTYKFGHKKPHVVNTVGSELVEQDYAATPQTATAQMAEVPVVAEETTIEEIPLNEVIYYEIRQNQPNPDEIITKIVNWARTNPNKIIEIRGYADKETGNAEINEKYSKERAESVAESLKQKGVQENRLEIHWYGDKIQPNAENDKNRCTIIVGK